MFLISNYTAQISPNVKSWKHSVIYKDVNDPSIVRDQWFGICSLVWASYVRVCVQETVRVRDGSFRENMETDFELQSCYGYSALWFCVLLGGSFPRAEWIPKPCLSSRLMKSLGLAKFLPILL